MMAYTLMAHRGASGRPRQRHLERIVGHTEAEAGQEKMAPDLSNKGVIDRGDSAPPNIQDPQIYR